MKLTGGSITIEMEMVEARVFLKLIGALSINDCEEICKMTKSEIQISDNIYEILKNYFNDET